MTEETLLHGDGTLERLATGAVWSEGPLWMPAERRLRWSDIPNDRILQWDSATGETSVHREGVEFTNGRLLDADGSVVQCSHGRRRLERERPDGTLEELVASWDGGRLNSPNDVAQAPDGSYWFTDPDYGISQPREGHPGELEYGARWVFRWSAADGLSPVITDIVQPNGIAFSPDGGTVYVTDTARANDDGPGHGIRAYDVVDRGAGAREGRLFTDLDRGVPDGITVDEAGRVWSSAGDGVHVFTPDGAEVLFVPVPEVVSNVCFGGSDGSDLFLTATTSLYRLRTRTRAAGAVGSRREVSEARTGPLDDTVAG
ncbi:SMP-30/gluconolactonase/LRE family protein [Rathayibacter sp. VKM Ac-2803]|uniref:SMP-30/gluconolactonase/LRE family protein n=1 Tax=Rathayibacter sp. VKM Ac-2803 TaxID=2609256 RepID=UPI0013585D96|nr:SMP-30/gluconolactonase/LRE family protein [Rathayibacter sp. VKM Ac-2803]MWV48746.1 SMP-30/gluconolactonase/LRE family protein [Rathayibacter sp. VKM Ac-2803]